MLKLPGSITVLIVNCIKMIARISLFCSLLVLCINAAAQPYTVSGHVTGTADTSALIGVTVIMVDAADTSKKVGSITDENGNFVIGNLNPGSYALSLVYLGYKTVSRPTTITDQNVSVGTVQMSTTERELKSVTISGTAIRAQQSGDTSSFNANAFKTNPDASAEDLVTKMPGVTSDGSGVKVNGENVQQVYIDGKPFFGTDPSLALKNLPAEVIDKIQVFDKLSDQSQFTGFDDGNGQKTINIVTKRGKSEGVFGKVYAGYGTDERYQIGGNANYFSGNRRLSILGMSNNINLQNFSTEDIIGAMGTSGQNRGGGGGFRGSGGSGFRGGGSMGGGNSANNFLVGQQNGIARTNSLGLNYSDNWGKKIKFSGSYFFNNTHTINTTDLTRNYYTAHDTSNIYNENYRADMTNANHRINMRLEYNIDSFNAIIFTPNISFQNNNTFNQTNATDSISDQLSANTSIANTANASGYNAGGNLLLQHKFKKPRRTISLNLNSSLNDKKGDGTYFSDNRFYEPDSSIVLDQRYTLFNNSNSVSGNLTYTEPVGKRGQIQANYNPTVTKSHADKETFNKNTFSGEYSDLAPQFSNKYDNTYTTHRGGLSYRLGDRKINFNAGLNVQYATLDGDQFYPTPFSIEKNFTSFLPNASFNNRYDDGKNLRIMYRTATQPPSISQLQNVVDVTNPLLLKTGNAQLRQDYEHTFIVRYGSAKAQKKNNFFVNLFANYINDYIANAAYIPLKDSLFTDPLTNTSILINRGSQLTRPVNLDGYVALRSFVTYGIPLQSLKCNLNLNGGINFTRNPGLINDRLNYSNNYVPSLGVVLSSNISEDIDFALSYTGSYNVVKNTLQQQADNNYYNHVASARINYIVAKKWVFNTNATHNFYTSFSSTGDQSFVLWNAYVAYKMLKNNALEARILAYDILKQNRAINRTVTETYIENSVTQVLQRYFMLQLTYTIRSFKGTMPAANADEGAHRHQDMGR
jgi:uncharacterized membrane protein YgcG